jgi:hypothetical protein
VKLASSEYRFDWSYGGIGPLAGLLGNVADLPEHDPELEQRLREAGLLETLEGFRSPVALRHPRETHEIGHREISGRRRGQHGRESAGHIEVRRCVSLQYPDERLGNDPPANRA